VTYLKIYPMRGLSQAILISLWAVLLSAGLLACSDDSRREIETIPPANTLKVQEVFNVGNNIFVRALAYDETKDVLWVGTSVGLVQVNAANGNVIATYTREQGLANEYVFSAMIDSKGNQWFGTNGGGVSRLAGDQWKTFFPMHGLADYWVYSFAEQKNGTIWIGTWNGLNAYAPESGKFHTYLKELVNEWVYGLDVDSKDRLWVGTEGGVNMFDGKTWSVWTQKDGLGAPNTENLPFSPNTGLGTRNRHDLSVMVEGLSSYNPNYVFAIEVDHKDQVWAGTWGGGVSRFDGKSWKNFTSQDGLAGNIVYSIRQDKQHVYWFGTNKGLSRFDGQSWTSVGKAEGLLDDHVYAVAVTKQGEIWAGTRHGVARLTLEK